MTNLTISDGVLKIHEGCGGLVRLREAVLNPNVKWTFECLWCRSDLVQEDCILLYDDTEGVDIEEIIETNVSVRAELEWKDEWDSYEDAVEGGLIEQLNEAMEDQR